MKFRIFIFSLICIFFFSCAQKLNDDLAASVINSSFDLTDDITLEIVGISMESKELALVKFKLNDVQISSKIRKYDKGWQLDDIQNNLGMWIPQENYTGVFSQAEKQKNAMKDLVTLSTYLMDYTTDFGVAPDQAGTFNESSKFYSDLCPHYAKALPIKDPWGNDYLVYSGSASTGTRGMNFSLGSSDEFIVMSLGRDGEMDSWSFEDAGVDYFEITSIDDYIKDLIMWNGQFVRAPRKK